MGFRKIDAREFSYRSIDDDPCVTIGKGRIYLNAPATSLIGINVERVDVYIDEKNSKLAIKPTDKNDASTFKLTKGSKGHLGRNINSKKLVKNLRGVNANITERFKAEWNDIEGWLEVDLLKPLT